MDNIHWSYNKANDICKKYSISINDGMLISSVCPCHMLAYDDTLSHEDNILNWYDGLVEYR